MNKTFKIACAALVAIDMWGNVWEWTSTVRRAGVRAVRE